MFTQRPMKRITSMLVISPLLPLILSLWIAKHQAHELFTENMDNVTNQIHVRTQRIAEQTQAVLVELSHFHGIPCSDEHLRLIQKVTLIHPYIQNIIYQKNSVNSCNQQKYVITDKLQGSEFITSAGYHIWLELLNEPHFKENFVAISYGKYIAVINPDALIDILPPAAGPFYVAVISTRGHRVVASNHPVNLNILLSTLRSSWSMQEINGYLYERQPLPLLGSVLLTWTATNPIRNSWLHQLLFCLPLGLIISSLTLFMVLRALNRIKSPRNLILGAIRRGEITVHYQPIVELKSGHIKGAEALARWQQSDGKWISPDVFIPLAEQTGIISILTEHIVQCVFNDMGRWLAQHPHLYVSINFSATDLHSPTLPELINQQIGLWRLSPAQIAIELTENNQIDPKIAAPVLQGYRNLGHTIYIDDFGTGYSNMSRLQELEVDTLKIDKSFVDNFQSTPIPNYIIEMAKALNLTMVAEGIETQAQRESLVEYGVQSGQGWLFSKPLDKTNFIRWVQHNQTSSSNECQDISGSSSLLG